MKSLALCIISTILLVIGIVDYIIRPINGSAQELSDGVKVIGVFLGVVFRTIPIITIWLLYSC